MAKAEFYNRNDIEEKLKQGKFSPAYLVYGSEDYLIDGLIEAISNKFLGSIEKEINYFLRFAPDTTLDEILALTSGGGLFSSEKVVVYKDYQNLRNPNLDRLLKYLDNPNQQICLLLIARTAEIRQAKFEKLKTKLPFINIQPLTERELVNFIRAEFKNHKKTITDEAIELLLYMVGDKIHDLKSEISQLCNFKIENDDIGINEIEEVVGVYVNQNVYEYINSISKKDLNNALYVSHYLMEKGENPGYFLSLLLHQIFTLWKIRGLCNIGITNDYEIGKELGLFSKFVKRHRASLESWDTKELRSAIELIDEYDRCLKNSQIRPHLLLDMLSLKLVNSKN
jgi:DNA polymerase-3 subunit delta